MKKVSAVLLFVALLAPAAVRAASADNEAPLLKRIASFLHLKSDPPARATAPRTALDRDPLGEPGSACVCVRGANETAGVVVIDPTTNQRVCHAINNRAPDLNP